MTIYTKPILAVICFMALCTHVTRAQDTVDLKKELQKHTLKADSLRKLKQLIYFESAAITGTSSSAMVQGTEFSHTPVVSYPMALAGRFTGLNITQSGGDPLNEGFGISLRNQSPLIFIDGIPRSVTQISMEEIESITVLKDAVATAMLGIRGSGGAISVVTKKGISGKQQINFSLQTGFQKPTDNLISRPLDAYRYALLYNEALSNDGLPVAASGYPDAGLLAYQNGTDPIRYPDVNWNDQVLKNRAGFARYNLNTRGGNQYVRYFVNVEHMSQDGMLKTSDINKYDTNSGLKAYFVRSNIDLNLTDELSAGIYVQGRLINTNSPGNSGTAGLFGSLLSTPSAAYPVYNADGSYGGTSQFQNNIVAQNIGSGYSLNNTRTILSDFYLKRTFNEVLDGLWMKARVSFFSNLSESINRNKSFAVFEQIGTSSGGQAQYRQYGTNGTQANANGIDFQNRSDFQEFSLGYSKTFGAVHDLDVTLLANRDNLINGSNLAYTIQGISGHASYAYQQKYLAEISFAYNGANRYPANGGFKYGFFPAIGLGWNINEENFLKSVNWLNHLKLYGSYGKTGQDNGAYYTYQQVYSSSASAIFGSSAAGVTSLGEASLANPNVTWEKAEKLNLGIAAAIWQNRLSASIEYYNNRFTDLSIVRGTNTGLLGIAYPNENIGKERYSGWEGELKWAEQQQTFGYSLGLNASVQQSELLYSAEAGQRYSWMQRTGNPLGKQFGYVAEGLFRNQQEIQGHATIEGYQPQPGDIKYKDLNGDGLINQYDQTMIGTKKPNILFGLLLGFNLKGLDFSALLQGRANREVYLSGTSFWEFQNNGRGQALEHHLERWTPATAETASYPRLSTGMGPRDGSVNNWLSSSYWLRNGDFMRLRTIELGYTLPKSLTSKVGMQSLRLYLNGHNLLTAASKTFDGADPENYGGSYPIQKVYTLGLNIQL